MTYEDERGEFVWRTVGGRRVKIYTGQSLEDAMSESGKFGKSSAKTSEAEKQKKIDSVKIDFSKDNTLPGLNKEDLKELGKESKPVLLKKSIIDRNLRQHPDVKREDYDRIIGQALYNSDERFGGRRHHNPDYMNFIKFGEERAALTLLELADMKKYYEIVHVFEPRNKSVARMKPKNK